MNEHNLDNSRALQSYIKSQVYTKGFSQAVNAGANTSLANVTSLGGSARRLYGLAIWVSQANIADDDTFSLTINNEQIIIKNYWRSFCPQFNYKMDMYFPIPRPLSGSDTIEMSWQSVGAKTVYPIFYLSDFPDNDNA